MSLTLSSYPVTVEGGVTQNVFPGFKAIPIEFSREDVDIVDIASAPDGKVQVNLLGDYTSLINEGDFIYIYSEGSTFTYDSTGEVNNIVFNSPNTEIDIDVDFIEVSTGGYCNYKQNYNVEMILTNPDNFDINLLGFKLKQSGSDSGEVVFDVSLINDLNKQDFIDQLTGREVEEGRIKFNVKYREVWREDDTAVFTEVDNPIIVLFATEDIDIEEFNNTFPEPVLYLGYPMGIGFIHSDSNAVGLSVKTLFDELDINKDDITTDNDLKEFDSDAYGVLLSTTEDTTVLLNANTKYIRIKTNTTGLTEYEPTEYSSEYSIN